MKTPINNIKDWNKTDISNITIYPGNDDNIISILKQNSTLIVNDKYRNLSANTDIIFSLPLTEGETLNYNSGNWINSAVTYSNNEQIYLNENEDVNTGSTTDFSVLYYTGDFWTNISLTGLSNNLFLDGDCLVFSDSTTEYKPFEKDKEIKILFDTLYGNGSSIYPARSDHNHNNLYSELGHTHNFATTGYTGELKFVKDNILKTFKYNNGVIYDKIVKIYEEQEVLLSTGIDFIRLEYQQYDKILLYSTSFIDGHAEATKYFVLNNEYTDITFSSTFSGTITIQCLKFPFTLDNIVETITYTI